MFVPVGAWAVCHLYLDHHEPVVTYNLQKINCHLQIINYKKFFTNFDSNLCLQTARAVQLLAGARLFIHSLVSLFFWSFSLIFHFDRLFLSLANFFYSYFQFLTCSTEGKKNNENEKFN